jgi:hypothetical protein
MRAALLLPLLVLLAWLVPGAVAQAQDSTTLESELSRAMRGASAASGAFVRDLDTKRVLFDSRSRVARIPASVEKLYTTSALWLKLGPTARFQTRVFGRGTRVPEDPVWRGDLYLQGGGDPSLSNTGLSRLARQIADDGIARVTGRVIGDETFFDMARGGPRTGLAYDSDIGGVLGGLTVGRGWSRTGGPAAEAALERWYRRAARAEIAPRLDAAVARAGTAYTKLTIRAQRTRWGSCSQTGAMSFNWRLLLAPEPVLDYVIEHEVCHLEVMDHSRRFWRLLESRVPDWREHAAWLRRYGSTLVL